MLSKLSLVFCIVLFCTYSNADDWKYPSDRDLKVAYCIKVEQQTLTLLEKLKNLEFARPSYEQQFTKVEKLKTYIKMKPNLNPQHLAIAMDSGIQDLKAVDDLMKKCKSTLPPVQSEGFLDNLDKNLSDCNNKFNIDIEYERRMERIRSCQNPNLLPY